MIRLIASVLRSFTNLVISMWLGVTTPLLNVLQSRNKARTEIEVGSVSPDYSLPDALKQKESERDAD